MKGWIATIIVVFTHPKQLMQLLPSTQLLPLGIISPLYFAFSRAFHPKRHAILLEELGGNLQIVLVVCLIAVVGIPLGGWIIQQILRLFRKRLSVIKILNINGYAHIPRLVVAGIGYILLLLNPELFSGNQPSVGIIAIIALGFAAILYTAFLMIYGYVVSPSEDKQVGQTRAL